MEEGESLSHLNKLPRARKVRGRREGNKFSKPTYEVQPSSQVWLVFLDILHDIAVGQIRCDEPRFCTVQTQVEPDEREDMPMRRGVFRQRCPYFELAEEGLDIWIRHHLSVQVRRTYMERALAVFVYAQLLDSHQ